MRRTYFADREEIARVSVLETKSRMVCSMSELLIFQVLVMEDCIAKNHFSSRQGVLPKYFSSEWSFAQFHLPECTQYIAAFGSQSTIVAAGTDGSFDRCSFDPVNGGEMVEQEYVRFLKTGSRPR